MIGRVELHKSNCVNRNVTEVNADVTDGVVVNVKLADLLPMITSTTSEMTSP